MFVLNKLGVESQYVIFCKTKGQDIEYLVIVCSPSGQNIAREG